MYFDTHAHLNFYAFDGDREDVIKKCFQQNVEIINVGSNFFTSKKAVEIAQNYKKGVYASVGLHPIHLETGLVKIKNDNEESDKLYQREKFFDYEKYKELAKSQKVVAIGETGLDYYWKPKTKNKFERLKQKQKELLKQHIDLAQELNLPVIFHCRMAHQDLIDFLKSKIQNSNSKAKTKQSALGGVIHCFTGTWQQAKIYLKMGMHLGFNGIIFKLDLVEVVKKIPMEKILLETDCPYLSPPEYKDRNDPMGVKLVAERIANIKKISLIELAKQTTQNAKELFKV